jgi:hypothetical protein
MLGLACVVAVALFALPAGAFAAEGGSCPNEAIRLEQDVTRLPDCRAYEMVTPPYKDGYPLTAPSFASDGEKVMLQSYGGFAGLAGSGEDVENNFYLGTRSAGGWRLSSMMAPLTEFVGQEPVRAEANDGLSLWYGHSPRQSAKTFELYVRSASGEYARVGTLTPTVVSKEESDVLESASRLSDSTIAATSTYQHVVLLANHPGEDYWSFDKTIGGKSLYEYSGTGNGRPVLVATTGEKPTGGEYHEELLADCGSELGSGSSFGSSYNALSADGETIFLTLLPCGSGHETAEVYARIGGSVSSPAPAETVDISENECTVACGEVSGKNFEGASENGEKVFFTSTQKLTNNASDLTAGGTAYQDSEYQGIKGCMSSSDGCNLYEYDFAQSAHEQLTLIAGGTDDVRGVAGIAEDGSRVYFVADGVIPRSGENEFGHKPAPGEPNLYVYDTDTGATAFIAMLSQQDDEADWARRFFRPVEVTGEGGRFLLFASYAPGVTPNEPGKSSVAQLFEYDAETGELIRVTQGEEGWNENGNGVAVGINPEYIELIAKSLGDENDFKSTTNSLNISSDGKTVVFETAGELSSLAQSASARGCTSVYEFRSEGPISAGTVHLLSDGRDVPIHKNEGCGAEFFEMDESGNNILFSTSDALLSSDVDGGQRNIYDARVNGGFPPESVAAPKCESEGCQGTFSSPPVPTTPGSLGQTPETPVAPAATTPAPAAVTKKTTIKCGKGVRHEKQCKKKAQTKRGSARKKSAHRKGSGRS